MKNKVDSTSWLRNLVIENKRNIFAGADHDLTILQVSVSRPFHRRGDRYHQILRIKYETQGGVYTKRIWLKYRNDLARSYQIHRAVCKELEEEKRFFPQPYFYGESHRNGKSVVGMEFVTGASLRNMVIRNAVYKGREVLEEIFSEVGAALRTFHDSSKSSGLRLVGELADNARSVTERSKYLSKEEREEVIGWIGMAERRAGAEMQLPLIKIHHDWILRNILITDTGSPYIVDLDSMRAPDNSRWYDVTCFLINLESQLKYRPLISRGKLANLWKSFWQGYAEELVPEGLSENQVMALIYLIKVEYLFGGTMRPPLFETYNKLLGRRYLNNLRDAVTRGEYSTLRVDL
ncbi:MAG: phosphotransferase [candidate division Zixibacteria bacterium]|nr:phosphotransferase [candidate division Zixibacteria bacterium]